MKANEVGFLIYSFFRSYLLFSPGIKHYPAPFGFYYQLNGGNKEKVAIIEVNVNIYHD